MTRVLRDVVGFSAGRTTPPDLDPADRSTRLAITRTDLALERTLMASERTLMAWVRTSLAMISFGFTLGKLGDALGSATVNLLPGHATDIIGVAYYLVILGTIALVLAAVQNRVEVAGLFRQGLARRPSLAFLMAILLSLLGMFVFTDLVTQLR
jgi:inner membrane protein YidH